MNSEPYRNHPDAHHQVRSRTREERELERQGERRAALRGQDDIVVNGNVIAANNDRRGAVPGIGVTPILTSAIFTGCLNGVPAYSVVPTTVPPTPL